MAQKEYNEPNIGELGFGIPGAGEGLEELYSDYLKPLYDSYGGGLESLMNPDMYQDAGRFGVNTLYDAGKFFGHLGVDAFQSLDRSGPKFLGGGGQDFLSTEDKYKLDALQSNLLGTPSLKKDNPFATEDSALMDNIYSQANRETEDYINSIMTDDVYDSFADELSNEFSFEDWSKTNRNTNPEEYKNAWVDKFNTKANIYEQEKAAPVFDNAVQGLLLGKYNIGGDQGAREAFDLENYTKGYAWSGEPLLEYETPRKDILTDAHLFSDLLVGTGVVKAPFKIGKRLFKGSKGAERGEGIMGNRERIEGPRFDFAEEYFRNRR